MLLLDFQILAEHGGDFSTGGLGWGVLGGHDEVFLIRASMLNRSFENLASNLTFIPLSCQGWTTLRLLKQNRWSCLR